MTLYHSVLASFSIPSQKFAFLDHDHTRLLRSDRQKGNESTSEQWVFSTIIQECLSFEVFSELTSEVCQC